jgi:hypothetical protein
MNSLSQPIYIGDKPNKLSERFVEGSYVSLLGEPFYQIRNYDAMEPFFISLISSSDHWLFISSTGGLSAGRSSAEQAIFPYYTVDRISENNENTGNKAILLVSRANRRHLWEPFSDRHKGSYHIERNLYKNATGATLMFEEINLDLGLIYRYAWRTSDRFGFVKTTWLINTGDAASQIEVLDGIQNILPASITSQTQNTFSVLLDAYKRSEIHADTGLGIFSLSSRLTDLAEPSEALLATTVAQVGLAKPAYLLSSLQLEQFRTGGQIENETEVRGQRCAYFAHTALTLNAHEEQSWHLLVDTEQDAADIAQKLRWLQGVPSDLLNDIEADIRAGQARLREIVAGADGIQLSEHRLLADHHFANVLFNVMRGGIFVDQYWIRAKDLVDFVAIRNRPLLHAHPDFFSSLPDKIHLTDLLARAEDSASVDLLRTCYTYLPLTFSRRHGDPSRPWNRFAINIKQPDGSQKLDYEGNWRDIFQNWEALACSYPEFIESMISTFLNATTADGYNPYRITYNGIDWEVPEPNNPWANIGYWSDHQIIYLLKLMELSRKFHPDKLQKYLDRQLYSSANIPYRIKPYRDLLKDHYNTIEFDWSLERRVEARVKEIGTDGRLVFTKEEQVMQVSLAEKLLVLLLAKLVNFVPEGGIWMNTQRPEWNDANNALVGKGLSVVTLCYLRRFIAFCQDLFDQSSPEVFHLSEEVQQFFKQVFKILKQYQPLLGGAFTDQSRRGVMDALGEAGSDYRWNYYNTGLSGNRSALPAVEIAEFLDLAQKYVEHSLRANRRSDHLYHAYNILHLDQGGASVSYLYEMLEGQVAILSSGMLDAAESLALLESLYNSALYQPETQSYILYPDRRLPGILEKNRLTQNQVRSVDLFNALIEAQDRSIITKDINGIFHFSGHFRNIKDVNQALNALKGRSPIYRSG